MVVNFGFVARFLLAMLCVLNYWYIAIYKYIYRIGNFIKTGNWLCCTNKINNVILQYGIK